jgi:hypothetical protein
MLSQIKRKPRLLSKKLRNLELLRQSLSKRRPRKLSLSKKSKRLLSPFKRRGKTKNKEFLNKPPRNPNHLNPSKTKRRSSTISSRNESN